MLKRLTVTAALALASAAPALAQDEAATPLRVERGEWPATKLLDMWADAQGLTLSLDPQLRQVRVTFSQATELDATSLRSVLEFHDIVLVRGPGDLLEAHHRRNVSQKVPPTSEHVYDDERVPASDRFVTLVYRVRHGAGNSLFSTLRGLLTRDTNRLGNILYVQGPEEIVVCDLGHRVRYYQEVLEKLDRPAPSAELSLALYEVPRASLAALDGLEGDAVLAHLREQDEARLLERATLDLTAPRFALERELELGADALRLQIRLGDPASAWGERPSDARAQTLGNAGESAALSVDLVLDGPAPVRRSVVYPIPAGAGRAAQTWVHTFAGREGAEVTSFVVVLRKRPRD